MYLLLVFLVLVPIKAENLCEFETRHLNHKPITTIGKVSQTQEFDLHVTTNFDRNDQEKYAVLVKAERREMDEDEH